MFTKGDYINYFDEIENRLKKTLVIYTDLLNLSEDKAIHSKLFSVMSENMEAYKSVKALKEKFK